MKLWKMSPENIADCFETLVKHHELKMEDAVFENHFLVLFWRRHKWFQAKNYPKILRGLHKLNYHVRRSFRTTKISGKLFWPKFPR